MICPAREWKFSYSLLAGIPKSRQQKNSPSTPDFQRPDFLKVSILTGTAPHTLALVTQKPEAERFLESRRSRPISVTQWNAVLTRSSKNRNIETAFTMGILRVRCSEFLPPLVQKSPGLDSENHSLTDTQQMSIKKEAQACPVSIPTGSWKSKVGSSTITQVEMAAVSRSWLRNK